MLAGRELMAGGSLSYIRASKWTCYCRSRRAMTAIWMGVTTVKKEVEAGELDIQRDKVIAGAMQAWLGLSPFAKEKSRLAA